ncbi:MAG: hypothetical protein HYX78_00355 [Armatimonadetes bacterium]|nr:hypothetical protein [Armatimonadota bacterium]
MAEKTEHRTRRARTAAQEGRPWWAPLGLVAGCVAAVVFAILHVQYGSSTPPRAAGTAVVSMVIFMITYLFFRRIRPKHSESSLRGLLTSAIVALPVFLIGFIGLGWELPEFADFGAMYIYGAWLGSAEAIERTNE